jgi:hypothetical protein
MKLAEATKFDRKSGVAKWRDLQLLSSTPSLSSAQGIFFLHHSPQRIQLAAILRNLPLNLTHNFQLRRQNNEYD